MKPSELLTLLEEFYRDKLALRARHETGARRVSSYEINNTYQYIIAREGTHIEWLCRAIEALGGAVPESSAVLELSRGDATPQEERGVLEDDVRQAQRFVDRWRGRLDAVTHARHRNMLRVIFGEALEHARFFEQALAGRADLLGRRPAGAGTGGGVLPTRWVE